MLGFFPAPYPDELLYSVLARLKARLSYPGAATFANEVFGDRHVSTGNMYIPVHLGALIKCLPPGHGLTANVLINNHTAFPYFAAFIQADRVEQIRSELTESAAGGKMIGTLMHETVRLPSWLRYCPLCVSEDREMLSETYWRRLHQIPGVEVCPRHLTFLEDAPVRNRSVKRIEYISAQEAKLSRPPRALDLGQTEHQLLLQISSDVQWLLAGPYPMPSTRELAARYRWHLANRGLGTFSGRMHTRELVEAFTAKYSSELLQRIGCRLRSYDRKNWLVRMTGTAQPQYPLRHMLLIRFLGRAPQEFLFDDSDLHPFGPAPWPCLNPSAGHYRQSVVHSCTVSFHQSWGQPVGTFECTCGFVYKRRGPDAEEADRLRYNTVVERGSTFRETLSKFWCNPDLSVKAIATTLGVTRDTVKSEALRMGLPFPRVGPNESLTLVGRTGRSSKSGRASPDSRGEIILRREDFLALRSRKPTASRTELLASASGSYLRRHDREWLFANLPCKRSVGGHRRTVDWKARDERLSGRVSVVAQEIRRRSGRPTQVTRTEIARALGERFTSKFLRKLPKTAYQLALEVESSESHACRCIEWAANTMMLQCLPVSRSSLLRTAGLAVETMRWSSVKSAIDRAVDEAW